MATREAPELTTLLLEAARVVGAEVLDGPPQLIGGKFNSEVLSEAISGGAINRQDSDLPLTVSTAQLDGIPVLIGELTGAASKTSIDPQLRRYRNQATIARSWLGSEAPNLQLFLIGPPGAFVDAKWRHLAAQIEADDRTCRKLVWLFNGIPSFQDAQAFLERTFIARPWPAEQRNEQLDSMANFVLPDGWEKAIEDPELDYDGLVERLIELEQGAGA
jgi:hypothetical protein